MHHGAPWSSQLCPGSSRTHPDCQDLLPLLGVIPDPHQLRCGVLMLVCPGLRLDLGSADPHPHWVTQDCAMGVTLSLTAAQRRCRGPGHRGTVRGGSWEFPLLHRERLSVNSKVTPLVPVAPVLACTGWRAEASPGHRARTVQILHLDTRDHPAITNPSSLMGLCDHPEMPSLCSPPLTQVTAGDGAPLSRG